MKNKIAVGIDIGTYQVKVVVTSQGSNKKGPLPQIMGMGYAESKGLRHGYIINQSDAIRSIRKAVKEAEKSSGIKIEKAFISIGGIGLSSYKTQGEIIISRADSEITEIDIEKVTEEALAQIPNTISMNHEIIHKIPLEYKIDNNIVLGDPVGMKGNKLSVTMLFVNCLTHHVNELVTAIESSGIEIADAVASPIAAGIVNLSRTERIAGCVMVNIGSETVSMIVYEEDVPISIEVFKVGSSDITNDIALGMQVSIKEAEKLKHKDTEYVSTITFKKTSEGKLQTIITNRLKKVFELIEEHLKKIDRSGLLPAGIILTGGGSGINNADELAKATLKLPSRVATIANHRVVNSSNNLKVKDSTWSVAYGLCAYGTNFEEENLSIFNIFKKGKSIKTLIKKIMP